jgi:sulfur-oxidizing protein SoxA
LRKNTKVSVIGIALLVGAITGAQAASVDDYRAALQDKDSNPAIFAIDRGETLFKTKRGSKNVSLETCDFGLGAGVLKGAYAQMPRYFKDSDRVEDVESRIVTCMVTLQGFDRDQLTDRKKLYADERKSEENTDLEVLAAYVAFQSDGMKINPPLANEQEKQTLKVGEEIFWTRHGPLDFSCATCHASDGKRVRLQPLVNALNQKDIQATMTAWPTYRVSHGVVRNNQHRMWDCNWQMRLPDIGYGSDASVALISFLTQQAKGGTYNIPGMKR